jgi:hypothetical protein
MIFVGLDDTDTLDTPGTNQLARALVALVAGRYALVRIVRHQLLFDPRVPYTSHNGSASILLEPQGPPNLPALIEELRAGIRAWFVPGSDPGLCVTTAVPEEVTAFGQRCQRELIRQDEARRLARSLLIHLEGLGGTQDGVIGALAAVGLGVTGDDGRVVQMGGWPDDLSGPQPVERIRERGVVVRDVKTEEAVTEGVVDVGKRLRPNCRGKQIVLFVERTPEGEGGPGCWRGVRCP